MDGAEGVTDFVSDDEPFSGCLRDNVGAGGGFVGVATSGGVVDADLAKPCVADCRARNAIGKHSYEVLGLCRCAGI